MCTRGVNVLPTDLRAKMLQARVVSVEPFERGARFAMNLCRAAYTFNNFYGGT